MKHTLPNETGSRNNTWIILLLAIATSILLFSCSSTKKVTEKKQSYFDSSYSVKASTDSVVKTEQQYQKETVNSVLFTDFFETEPSTVLVTVNPADTSTEVFETDKLKVTATKQKDGKTKLQIDQKPQKAHGKGSSTTVTKESGTNKHEGDYSHKGKQAGNATHAESTITKGKEKENAGSWPYIIAISALCLIVLFFLYRKLNL